MDTADSNIAFALSVKNIIWTVDNTATKKTLFKAMFFPAIIIAGKAISATPTMVAGAISTAFGLCLCF